MSLTASRARSDRPRTGGMPWVSLGIRTKDACSPDSGSTPPQWTADKPFEARRQDFVECLARPSQAARSLASGRGIGPRGPPSLRTPAVTIWRVPPDRGWYQVRLAPQGEEAPPPRLHSRCRMPMAFRQCAHGSPCQVGVYHGPVDGDEPLRCGRGLDTLSG